MRKVILWSLVATLVCGAITALTSCKNDDNAVPDTTVLTEWQAGKTVDAEAVAAYGGIDKCFATEPIPDDVWARMQGKTFKENPYIGRDDLRHVRALHWDYDNQMHVGEMVCNVLIADCVVGILRKLFDAKYPIQRMLLPDVYDADDETQMRDNNSSCFCYRNIAATNNLSKHARGLAVDINTLYNPYIKTLADGTLLIEPATGEPYCDRSWDFPYKITHDDFCFKLFTEAGFDWGGDWTNRKDYQHFEWMGVLPGRFTVNSEGLQVQFSQGNLQYQASSHTWRFAEHQYDIVGDATIGNVYENDVKSDNTAISSDYNGWIDLFGWGTGINPTLATTENGDYSVYSEWGDNAIQNSAGYTWRTLTSEENVYLFHDRSNAAKLFGLGSVDGVNGVIILPDDWTMPDGLSFTPSTTKGLEWNGTYYFNENADNYSHNTYTIDEWRKMESTGAVFLPAAGYREGTNVSLVGMAIDYWLATQHGTAASGISGNSKRLHPHSDGDLYYGDCVRLVR